MGSQSSELPSIQETPLSEAKGEDDETSEETESIAITSFSDASFSGVHHPQPPMGVPLHYSASTVSTKSAKPDKQQGKSSLNRFFSLNKRSNGCVMKLQRAQVMLISV